MSSYYDSIGTACRDLDTIEKLAALIMIRDEWKERIECELFVPLVGDPVDGAEEIVSSFKVLSGRVDALTSSRDEWRIDLAIQDFHSLAHRLGGMRVKYFDDDAEECYASDNPRSPQGKWIKYLSQLAELRATLKSKVEDTE